MSTTHQPLPAVGTRYESLEHFKLDIYRIGYNNAIQLGIIRTGKNRWTTMRCPLRGTDISNKETGEPSCSCTITCRKVRTEGDKQFEITGVEEKHTCSATRRAEEAESARMFNRERVKLMENLIAQIAAGRGEGAGSGPGEASGSGETPATRGSKRKAKANVEEEPPKKETRSSAAASKDKGKDKSKDKSNSKAKAGKEDKKSSRAKAKEKENDKSRGGGTRTTTDGELFPLASVLTKEIDALAAFPVAFPTEVAFATPRDLLVHLYAHAKQQHFTLNRRTSASTATGLVLICSKGQAYHSETYRCPYKIRARMGEDGSWRISEKETVSNHSEKCDAARENGGSRKRRRMTSPPPDVGANAPGLQMPTPQASGSSSTPVNGAVLPPPGVDPATLAPAAIYPSGSDPATVYPPSSLPPRPSVTAPAGVDAVDAVGPALASAEHPAPLSPGAEAPASRKPFPAPPSATAAAAPFVPTANASSTAPRELQPVAIDNAACTSHVTLPPTASPA
ncbi:hypothetical protein JCM21900_000679 [Sporobolomyces salmonicolor]